MKKVVEYKHKSINYGMTFETKNGQLMVNATELAKPFDEFVGNFLRLESTKNFIDELNLDNENSRFQNFEVLKIIKGGNKQQGTWMCEELAIKFAIWLSPSFELWVYKNIKNNSIKNLENFHSNYKKNIEKRNFKTYIMIDSTNGYYKIGKSEKPHYREKTLQSEKPTIKLLHILNRDVENILHKKYESKRIRGEWFQLNEIDIRNIIEM